MGKASRLRGGARGGGRGRGPVSADNDVRRAAATITDAATRLGFQVTNAGTGLPPDMQFLLACNDGDVNRLKAVVDSMDEDARESLASVRVEDFGGLHSAASSGHMAICKYLVEQLGFDVNSDATNNGSGVTPLSCAVSHEKVIAVRYFLEKGADPNIKHSSNGTAALHEAVALGHDEITQLLLAKGANVDEPSDHGTPLVAAAAHGAPCRPKQGLMECLKLLVEAGADVKCTNPEAPLAIATTNGLTKCAEYLLEVATNVNVPVKHDTDVKTGDDDRKARLKSNGAKAGQWDASKFYTEDGRKARLKSSGAKAVEGKDYAAASKFYTEAIKLDPADPVLYSNRSLCYLKCGEEHDALVDANACVNLQPEWPKGYYRKGVALMSLLEYKEAGDAFLAGMKLAPENKEMKEAYWEAVEAVRKEASEPSLYELD
ncbi:unnamed protein product [Alopecurus aequalis]